MIVCILIIVAFGIFEIYRMSNMKLKKEIIVYTVLSLLSIVLAVLYFKDSLDKSISVLIMNFLDIKH